jgi:hypothetical protein
LRSSGSSRQVPKDEIDRREAEYQKHRAKNRKKAP